MSESPSSMMELNLVSRLLEAHYTRVPESEEIDHDNEATKWRTKSKASSSESKQRIHNILLIAACFSAGVLGYMATYIIANNTGFAKSWASQALELNEHKYTFTYNRSFSYPPSNHTNTAWRNIFPKEGGFFIHPTIAPTRSTFSVFHQLHCLNGLRGGYFANQRAASSGRKLKDEDLPVDIRLSHMRHCIDLIRQSLMCNADTTLEVVDESINGVHGFRTAHICKDWEQLKDWTSRQQDARPVEQIV